MPWSARFDDPIKLPDGRTLRTLRDAGNYIAGLSKAKQKLDHWQLAAGIVLRAAEGRDFRMHAHIAMMQAIHHGRPEPPREPRKKRAKKYRIVR